MKEKSFLVQRINELSEKPIEDLEIEDLRIMIGQNINLNQLIPRAISILKTNILAEGDFYPGDLLINVLTSNPNFWKANKNYWSEVINLIKSNESILSSPSISKILTNNIDSFSNILK